MLTPAILGVDTGQTESSNLSKAVSDCSAVIRKHFQGSPETTTEVDGYIEEFLEGSAGRDDRDKAIDFLARLVTAVPVIEALIPSAPGGDDDSEETSAARLATFFDGEGTSGQSATESVARFMQACRRCRSAIKATES